MMQPAETFSDWEIGYAMYVKEANGLPACVTDEQAARLVRWFDARYEEAKTESAKLAAYFAGQAGTENAKLAAYFGGE